MNDLSLQFSVMAHLRPVTEVEVVRQVDAWVLAIGSGAWDSPSGGRVTLSAERAEEPQRVADAITACLAAGDRNGTE